MATPTVRTEVTEIVAAALAEGRATPEDSVRDILAAEGYIVGWPKEFVVDPGRPGHAGGTAYMALTPLSLGSPDGSTRRLQAGDFLHRMEAEHAGSGLTRMVRQGRIAALPVDRGVAALVPVLFARIDRLERLLADLHGAAAE